MIPLFEKDGFIICFEALEENIGQRQHFQSCGWTQPQLNALTAKRYAWFCAKVSAWKDGKELGTDYLGCCSYKTVEEFYTRYRDHYFADMVNNAIAEAKGKS